MSVLTLADAKLHLNMTDTANDNELQSKINAAESSIAAKCGPLAPTVVTCRARGGKSSLAVPVTPVISLTSVTPVGVGSVALDVSTLNLSGAGVEYLSGNRFRAGFYDVAYLAGRTVCPDDLLEAVREHLRHLWDSQRGGVRKRGADPTPAAPGAAAFAFTWKVNELIAPYVQGGFA